LNKTDILAVLEKTVDKKRILIDEPMKNHTSFKIGGPADFLVLPEKMEEITGTVINLKKENIPYMIIGNASNLLVRDKGIRGVVIKLGESYNHVTIEGTKVTAEPGILLSRLAKRIAKASLKGFEFASGIPGSLGGAVFMNAGAYGGEMKDVVTSVKALNDHGEVITLSNQELQMRYRNSILQEKHYAVLEVEMELEFGESDEIYEKIRELDHKRTTKQPIHLPSAGSVFKRPEGYFAGKLIQDSGLKGCRIGGAEVSTLHCGFIVNQGEASAQDVIDLVAEVQKNVKEKFGVDLERELRIIGEE